MRHSVDGKKRDGTPGRPFSERLSAGGKVHNESNKEKRRSASGRGTKGVQHSQQRSPSYHHESRDTGDRRKHHSSSSMRRASPSPRRDSYRESLHNVSLSEDEYFSESAPSEEETEWVEVKQIPKNKKKPCPPPEGEFQVRHSKCMKKASP